MNKIILLGRFVKDPELRSVESADRMITKFVIAVSRNFKETDGSRKADFIRVRVWGKKAEVICKNFRKGDLISLSGSLRTGSYEDQDGNKKYYAEVVAEDFKFVGPKRDYNQEENDIEIVEENQG